MGCCISEPKETVQNETVITSADQPITHRFSITDEDSFVSDLYDQTALIPVVGGLIVQYAALLPGETPDRQVFNAAIIESPLGVYGAEQFARIFRNGLSMSHYYGEEIGFITTDQPHIQYTARSDNHPSRLVLPQIRENHPSIFRTPAGFRCEKQRMSSALQGQVAHVPHIFSYRDKPQWAPYTQTDTFAFFYNKSKACLWASPWCSNDADAEHNSGFPVIVKRDGNTINFPEAPLYEIENGRFIQIFTDTYGYLMDIFEYRFEEGSNFFLQRSIGTETPPTDFLYHPNFMSIKRNNGKLVFISLNCIHVMFFTKDACTWRFFLRGDKGPGSPWPEYDDRIKRSEYACGDWLVVLYQHDNQFSVSRISLDTRFLTEPTSPISSFAWFSK